MRFGNRRRVSTNVSTWLPTRYGPNGPDGTRHYVPIIIQSSQVSSALTDFPVYVDLSTLPAAFWTNVQSDGGDIRVATAAGVQVPAELVSINTGSETGELHFLASSVSSSSNTEFRIYYDGETTLSQPGVATTYGRNAVWSDYEGVWHDGGYLNSATGDTSTEGGGVTGGGATGKVGSATSFDGSNDYLRVPSTLSGSFYTIETWVTPGLNDNNFDPFIASVGAQLPVIWFGEFSSSFANETFSYVDATLNIKFTTTTTTGWTHVAMRYDGSEYDLFVNGAEQTFTVRSGDSEPSLWSNDQIEFGARTNYSEYGNVTLDEIRIRNVSTSSSFVSSQYTNQNTPSTFYNVGSQANA